MCSRAMATFATFAGMEVQRLTGWYRADQKYVIQTFEPYELKSPIVLLHRMTGVGKTTLIHAVGKRTACTGFGTNGWSSRLRIWSFGQSKTSQSEDVRCQIVRKSSSIAPYIIMEAERK